ncbi:MAG TPA: class I SAM-dependent methyltransferase [Acidimicrobiia bacterium]|nr:class I SAM-dependent methyltransferase [Acidimicrobiia bacterium]
MKGDPWPALGAWWLEELSGDPAYEEEVYPWLLDLLAPVDGDLILDIGCGDGRLMSKLSGKGASVIGCDFNRLLLSKAIAVGPVVAAKLPQLTWVRQGSFDKALVGLVLEHLPDERDFFQQVAAVVKRDGVMAIVINHPVWTAPKSSPMEDSSGETLWRPGVYFGRGYSDEPAGRQTVRFYHRTMADLLNAASDAGWDLERLEEKGISAAQVKRYPEYAGQEHIPRLLGAKWRRRT